MTKIRLDQKLLQLGAAPTRSQAKNYIKLGYVLVDVSFISLHQINRDVIKNE